MLRGGGKTTDSIEYIKNNENGIYLAFNNKVVDTISNKGFLSKTIDSFFVSYIIPKLTHLIPLINNGSKISFVSSELLPDYRKGVLNIKIDENGDIYNKSSNTGFNLRLSNDDLYEMPYRTNLNIIKEIFGKSELTLTDTLRSCLCHYLIKNYPTNIIEIIEERFSYVIIDEAQDLKDFREEFADLLSHSKTKLIVLGDDNQNINGGGNWFENLKPTSTKDKSHRCPEINCLWIRENLKIKIFGNDGDGGINLISMEKVGDYDDGNRTLLYDSKRGAVKNVIENWKGPTCTIKTSKGQTINNDIVIIGKTLNIKNMYTAITRTKKMVYLTPSVKDS